MHSSAMMDIKSTTGKVKSIDITFYNDTFKSAIEIGDSVISMSGDLMIEYLEKRCEI